MRLPYVRTAIASLALATGSLFPAVTAAAEGWPTFRGADRSAVSSDKGLLQAWPEGGPKLLWETTGLGRGYASVSVAGDKLFTLGDSLEGAEADDKDEYLICLAKDGGNVLWKSKLGPAWNNGSPNWQSSRSTPTVDGDLVYALTAYGRLICSKTSDGSEVWRKDLKEDFGGSKGDSWGYSESVLVDGDLVVCTPGSDKNTMVALNKLTGETVWSAVREGDRGAGHASIVISNIGGTKVYVQTTASGALGVRASDGKLLWSYEIDKTTAVIPTPIVKGDYVFFSAGYKRGGALLKQVAGENGEVKVEEVYPLNTALANKHGGIVLVGDYLFGDSDDAGIPFCADLMTGEIKWKERGVGKGSVTVAAADGCLYLGFQDGTIALMKAGDKHEELGSFKAPGSGDRPSWAHPVITGGKLYLRENGRVLCYDVSAAK
ncbi:FOG: WD40 repeat-like protein [Pirellula staleyi DSM 6068]|uniref:FOG: WD40 repeat-like protein n=1 Tax=Pirellula staleyi (strain ATCC 27377 / DSM 6068 / ICPB 4128) TaxID=530564 RepID=D2R335_PIRSD|nr:PQQ-binding-like beta-propeller repeat protein [Pirellula staleyi]ADB18768.1 FOG: WD40 repeat-like protein [Pirellula staleyi DSM 6068]